MSDICTTLPHQDPSTWYLISSSGISASKTAEKSIDIKVLNDMIWKNMREAEEQSYFEEQHREITWEALSDWSSQRFLKTEKFSSWGSLVHKH